MAGEDIPAFLLDNPLLVGIGGNLVFNVILFSVILQQRGLIKNEREKQKKILHAIENNPGIDEKLKELLKRILDGE